ncbi:DUF3426 domain-containing protein [Aliikangiella maris]|uniref:DUF3426 domain-containing protein n=2 Tax=Aliikangiella maris TaxID=3162458 RepID=A0ABV2BY47_9GAMM
MQVKDKTQYTRCPECKTVFKVTDQMLAMAHGKVRCGACLEVFQATDYLLRPRDQASAAGTTANKLPTQELSTADTQENATYTAQEQVQSQPIKPDINEEALDIADEIDFTTDTKTEIAADIDQKNAIDESFTNENFDAFDDNDAATPESDLAEQIADFDGFDKFDSFDEFEEQGVNTLHIDDEIISEPLSTACEKDEESVNSTVDTRLSWEESDEVTFSDIDGLDNKYPELESPDKSDAKTSDIKSDTAFQSESESELESGSGSESEAELISESEYRPESGLTGEEDLIAYEAELDESDFIDDETDDSKNIDMDSDYLAESLTSQIQDSDVEPDPLDEFEGRVQKNKTSLRTLIIVLLLLALIGFGGWQFWKNRQQLAWDSTWGEVTQGVCEVLPCELKPRRDVSRIRVVQRLVTPAEEGNSMLDIKISMINEAAFEQPFPRISIQFSNSKDELVATQHIEVGDYLPQDAHKMMRVGQEVHIGFLTKLPHPDASGFEFIFN